MKSGKDAQRIARQLLKATVKDGVVDAGVVKTVARTLIDKQPRGFLKVLSAYTRLVRLELERTYAVVESAQRLDVPTEKSVEADLQKKYGGKLTVEFREKPGLIGGMRVRVGSDVWDGSVKNRLDRLRNKFH